MKIVFAVQNFITALKRPYLLIMIIKVEKEKASKLVSNLTRQS